jgi:hypothetical protein
MGPKRIVMGMVGVAVLVGTLALGGTAASGGGAVLETVEDSYAPGEQARAWSSVSWAHYEGLGTPENGPYEAYLLPMSADGLPIAAFQTTWPGVPDEALHVGQLTVSLEPFDAPDGFRYGPHSAVLDFEVPEVPDGEYEILHCNDPCTTTLGDITWGRMEVSGSAAPPLTEVPWDEQVEALRIAERQATLPAPPTKLVASGQPPQPGAALPALAVAVLVLVTAAGVLLVRRSRRGADGLDLPDVEGPAGAARGVSDEGPAPVPHEERSVAERPLVGSAPR